MRMWAFGQNPPRVTENTYKGLTSKEGSATLKGLGTAPNVPRDDAREEERTNQQEEAPRAAPVETTSTEENIAELGDDDQPGPEEAFLDERGELDNLDDSWGSEKAPTANGQLKALDDRTRWLNENRPKHAASADPTHSHVRSEWHRRPNLNYLKLNRTPADGEQPEILVLTTWVDLKIRKVRSRGRWADCGAAP